MKETLAEIAWAINEHTITEHQNMPCQGGVARYLVDLEEMPEIHQVFLANVKVRKQVWYGDDSMNIWKNSKLGGALIMKGISRATTHLAATFTQEEGNEDIIKYFDKTVNNWKI